MAVLSPRRPIPPSAGTATPSPDAGLAAESAVDDLVRAAAAGDEGAFKEIFHRYHPRVWRAAYLRLGNRHDADDAASDTFVRLHRAIRRYSRRSDASFDAFVLRIAERAAIDVHRRRQRHRTEPLETEPVAEEPTAGADPALHAAFARLPAADRELLVLRVVEGRSSEEVARLTGRSPGAIRVAQHRALGRLRAVLEGGVT